MSVPRRTLLAISLLAAACGDDGASPAREVLDGYVAVGASLTAGFMSDGLVHDGQEVAYPSQLARAGGAAMVVARIQPSGCVPPLVAPLYLDRTLSGRRAFTAPRDTTCVGRFADSVFARNVAVPEMTAYQALRYTADSAARLSDPRARRALPQLLLPGFTQVTQALFAGPTLVSVELGFTELVRAARTGRVVAATAETYRADTGFTYVPVDVWRPVYDSVLAALSTVRRGALLAVASPTAVPALARASVLALARDSLVAWGVRLGADCAGSENLVHLAKVAAAAARAARAGAEQGVSCADVPGAADSVLTPAEVATLHAVRTAMNAHILQAATDRGWAFVEYGAPGPLLPVTGFYSPGAHLALPRPFDPDASLDGIYPDARGHRAIAHALAASLSDRYGVALVVPVPDPAPAARPHR